MLKGMVAAMFTPVENQRVSFAGLEAYVQWLIEQGTEGLFFLGTTGEGLLVPENDREAAVACVVKAAANRVPVVVQCGGMALHQTLERVSSAVRAGADAIALLTPFFYAHDQQALERYYDEVLAAWPEVPFYLYSIPKYANNAVSPNLLQTLLKRHVNLIGIKDSSGSVEQLQAYRDAAPEAAVFIGSDTMFQEAYVRGAAGVVSGLAAVFPALAVRAWRRLSAGDSSGAQQMKEICDVFHEFSTIPAGRAVLTRNGMPVGEPFKPLLPLTVEQQTQLFSALQRLDLGLLRQD
ncbi:dihydrodipicolinate synthase family protein [Alicyclobacillus cycloheptanicus]|uniref:4-hydroxy-tetrahydrodipicolinate synthase n=1 Tax=Alicyclobacillus cycloheptanicus TaxID=1457 RepID=A0ABT9XH37_9BACL|nr:dihydrodipicolinate synthase family protein [Alicyclobacillus cycloheptanicus]MDQ0189512.1 4-hydroxy-tetrahydrodipicolinate synthase [Alicyclobacillus cycloheptanicus]WDM01574.1 dihydrodipicolinate synthase family protein [Alicyclobacillus cycloheptanicus]